MASKMSYRGPSIKAIRQAIATGTARAVKFAGAAKRGYRRARGRARRANFGVMRITRNKFFPWVLLAAGAAALYFFWPKIKSHPKFQKLFGND